MQSDKMTIAELIEREGGNAAFSRALKIPLKTAEGWKAGKHCADYNVEAYRKALLYDQQNEKDQGLDAPKEDYEH